MADSPSPQWLVLAISLPGQNATARMRVWRGIKALGAAVLRDGVYLLPARADLEAGFRAQAQEVIEAGGAAYLLPVGMAEDAAHFEALFSRNEEYAALCRRLREFADRLTAFTEGETWRRLNGLRREFEQIVAIDYFSGTGLIQAQEAVAAAEEAVNRRFAPDEPSPVAGGIRRRDPDDYQDRLWVTRKRLWVDRLASAWLIRRFIDRSARFRWYSDTAQCPSDVVGFDFDGAEFTHVGHRVTFEVLMESFGLEHDPALLKLAELVHYLDVGGMPVPEAAGFSSILTGARERLSDDDALLEEGGRVLDHLYAAYQLGLSAPAQPSQL